MKRKDLEFKTSGLSDAELGRVTRKFLANLPSDPQEITSAVRYLMALHLDNEASPLPSHRPKKWTLEWQSRLFIFVQRRIQRDWHKGLSRLQLASRRREAFEEAALRDFPFHVPFSRRKPTPEAVKKQFQNAEKALKQHEGGGLYLDILFALHLEALYGVFGESTKQWLREHDLDQYPTVPDWAWETLATTRRLLPPDVQRKN